MAAAVKTDHYLTPAEAAAPFRVSPKTVRCWAVAGKLTSIRTLGGHRRYRASDIRQLFEPNEWAALLDVTGSGAEVVDVRDHIRSSANEYIASKRYAQPGCAGAWRLLQACNDDSPGAGRFTPGRLQRRYARWLQQAAASFGRGSPWPTCERGHGPGLVLKDGTLSYPAVLAACAAWQGWSRLSRSWTTRAPSTRGSTT